MPRFFCSGEVLGLIVGRHFKLPFSRELDADDKGGVKSRDTEYIS